MLAVEISWKKNSSDITEMPSWLWDSFRKKILPYKSRGMKFWKVWTFGCRDVLTKVHRLYVKEKCIPCDDIRLLSSIFEASGFVVLTHLCHSGSWQLEKLETKQTVQQHMNQLSASVRFWLDSQMSLITPDEFCSCSVGSLYSLRSFCKLPPAGYSKEYSFKLQASAGLFIPRGYIHLLCTACGKFWNIELYLGKCSIQALWKSF